MSDSYNDHIDLLNTLSNLKKSLVQEVISKLTKRISIKVRGKPT